ncbi:DUF4258 domain-containing protein [Corallococcus macrosporus]|uniref:DUF4258 domain-containing protein n=1 Tax=Corallococcus macrosporus DSM 14697 TaxID=1189310 RepID=A0A250JM87_9BACT|nr:DUF4258 domain-containing protein [Corallococcus macrosporus]ATB44607.1 hypothetical protein MYMAC_000178 [Corallococcus macrosporus DSM 14697]
MSKEPFKRFEALKFSRRLLNEGSLVLKQHAKDRMKERKLATTDIENIIEGGAINNEGEQQGGRWTYVIETPRMGLAVAFRCDEAGEPSELVIVSVWRKS